MRRYYEEHTGRALEEEMGEVEAALKSCGVVYEGKLYLPQNMLDEEMKGKVLSFIDGCLKKATQRFIMRLSIVLFPRNC